MTISFVGGGVMAEALIKGIIKAGIATPGEIIVSEPVSARRIYLEAEFGIKTVEMNIALVGGDELQRQDKRTKISCFHRCGGDYGDY